MRRHQLPHLLSQVIFPTAGLIQIGLPRWPKPDLQRLDKDLFYSVLLFLHSKPGVLS